ncbi:MAG: hypothetical protein CVU12_01100 [Bacteroidetes bacterium HGW-Bacteroidetes-7]|jgi:cell division protein FtsQ|nr:MAG: hypothetical protein CVU12_01100 [Bacteroidetes bacterium HGW-Bacteroidetes-7]
MFKKILIYTGYVLITAALVAYFFWSSVLTAEETEKLYCTEIKVSVLDSAQNRFVSPAEIKELLRVEGITPGESKIRHINLYELENTINNKTAVKISQVSVNRRGILYVDITQRRPVLRLETANGGFYMDETAYIFPLMRSFTSYVPVVTGNIPLNIPVGFRGELKNNQKWAHMIHNLGIYLERESFWNSMVEQIYVDEKGVLSFIPRVGSFEVIFGEPDNIEYKFHKLEAFYSKVIPAQGWSAYKSVDLRYGNQLVCKKSEKKTEEKSEKKQDIKT